MSAIIRNKQECSDEYREKLSSLENLLGTVKDDLQALLKQANIPFNSLIGRIKEFESYYEKISDGSCKNLKDPINNLQDLVGVRIVVIFIDDLNNIENIFAPTFEVTRKDRRGSENPDNTFGYTSDHYILKYKEVKGPRYEKLLDMQFELQVRTTLMDAWANLSHELEYKTKEAIPTKLRKTFFGLSGMFFVADKTFQDLKDASSENKIEVATQNKTLDQILEKEINLDTLKTYLLLKFPDRYIYPGSNPQDDDARYSKFIKEISVLNRYKKIADLDIAVNEKLDDEMKSEERDKGHLTNGRRHLLGTLRGIMHFYDKDFKIL